MYVVYTVLTPACMHVIHAVLNPTYVIYIILTPICIHVIHVVLTPT